MINYGGGYNPPSLLPSSLLPPSLLPPSSPLVTQWARGQWTYDIWPSQQQIYTPPPSRIEIFSPISHCGSLGTDVMAKVAAAFINSRPFILNTFSLSPFPLIHLVDLNDVTEFIQVANKILCLYKGRGLKGTLENKFKSTVDSLADTCADSWRWPWPIGLYPGGNTFKVLKTYTMSVAGVSLFAGVIHRF